MSHEIDTNANFILVDQIKKRIAELVTDIEIATEDPEYADIISSQEELDHLQHVLDEVGSGCDLLIRDSYFTEYARDTAEELFDTDFSEWPYYCIDWEYAAKELQSDYYPVVIFDVRYWGEV